MPRWFSNFRETRVSSAAIKSAASSVSRHSKESLWGAEDYYDAVRVNGFDPNNVRGMTLQGIQELDSGLLGIDANLKPAMWYYNVHPEDNTWNDKFGSFINVNRVEQNEEIPRGLKIQMYVEFGFAVLEPRAVLFQEGI